MKEKLIEFLRKKDYRLIMDIGQGGTGRTVLLEDETINEKFVCKKYSPLYEEDKEIYFKNFMHEIKLLHLLYHKNVVRVFNYYLYPEYTTGYILMEFVDGQGIDNYLKNNSDKINEIFIQVISGFRHLEENDILHRDIRPENIMVSNESLVKIIDFGFGKKLEFDGDSNNSVSLNWRYMIPNDFKSKRYDFRTEIYFIGKMFEEIISDNNIQSFLYSSVLMNMIKHEYSERISSFFDIDRKIIEGDSSLIEFSYTEKEVYKKFAEEIGVLFTKIETSAEYFRDIDEIVKALENCYRNSILEDFVQNPNAIARCFINGQYFYKNNSGIINVSNLKNFIKLLKSVSTDKKRIIINNLWQRLDGVKRYTELVDDLPF